MNPGLRVVQRIGLLRRNLASSPSFSFKTPFSLQQARYSAMATSLDKSTWKFHHTGLRVKDPKVSLKFYEFLGLSLLKKIESPQVKLDSYLLAYDSPKALSHGHPAGDREGVVELIHNYGTENDAGFKANNGNEEPHRGFGHLCISVDNLQAACKRIEDAGYRFKKKLTDGRMRNIAFALDPDGYWVEVIGQKPIEETENITETDPQTYRMNHTMVRVKDIEKSLAWYQDVLGMKLVRTLEQKEAGFNLYFLCFADTKRLIEATGTPPNQAFAEGLLELTWNYGTEKDANFKYHNGNEKPEGFGRIAIAVDDLDAAVDQLERVGVKWVEKLNQGPLNTKASFEDPDGYWIEVVQNPKYSNKYAM